MSDLLATVPLLQALNPEQLATVRKAGKRRRFAVGRQLLHQGDVGESIHVILRGRVRVLRSHPDLLDPVELAELGPGELVGEMGVIDGEPRSASVVALERTETLELGKEAVMQLLAVPAAATTLLKVLTTRLRATDDLAVQVATPR